MKRELTLPTFFVIGAAKCGTTSLHAYLDLHPEITMSDPKEPQIFAGPGDPEPLLPDYAAMFASGLAVRGEASAVYTQHPRWTGVAERILEHVPDAQFIYLVRDPIERAVAHWSTHVADGKERRSPAAALRDFDHPFNLYVGPSRYRVQLSQYLQHDVDADRILVLDQAELLDARQAALARIFSFLGVDAGFRSAQFERQFNVAAEQRTLTALGRRLAASRTSAHQLPIPGPVRRRLRGWASRPVRRPELDARQLERIREHLYPEVTWLREFTGSSFSSWSV